MENNTLKRHQKQIARELKGYRSELNRERLEALTLEVMGFASDRIRSRGFTVIVDDFHNLANMLTDGIRGHFPMPWKALLQIGAAILYVISPVDAIPDFLPVVGWADDGAVIAGIFTMLASVIDSYRQWRPVRD